MNNADRLTHEFVEFIPDRLEQGKLYISIQYATASHLCCCGCGSEVVTPFTPTDWTLSFDGETASLDPSISNWSFPCRSHYWIKRNTVRWAGSWTEEQVQAGRARDARNKQRQFTTNKPACPPADSVTPATASTEKKRPTIWRRVTRWLGL